MGRFVEAVKPSCKRCGSPKLRVTWQTFTNQTRHLRQECSNCGTFQRYLPQHGLGELPNRYEEEADAQLETSRPCTQPDLFTSASTRPWNATGDATTEITP